MSRTTQGDRLFLYFVRLNQQTLIQTTLVDLVMTKEYLFFSAEELEAIQLLSEMDENLLRDSVFLDAEQFKYVATYAKRFNKTGYEFLSKTLK